MTWAPALGQPPSGGKPGKAPPLRLLSRAELRACMNRETTLQQRQDALVVAQAAHTAEISTLSEEAKRLAEELKALDTTDDIAVDEYNRRNAERNERVGKANARAEALNATGAELQSDNADYMKECVARPYLQSDRDALLREAGRNGSSNSPRPDPAGRKSGSGVDI